MPPRRHLLAAIAVAGVASLFLLTFGHGRDQGIYAAVGRTILEGGAPYRDAFDFKPPGIHLAFAAAEAAFGRGERAIRVLEALCLTTTAALLVDLSWRWWRAPGVGLLAAALTCLTHVQLDFWHTAQPEGFGGMAIVAALRAAWRGPRSTGAALAVAGLLFGVAGLMKPPLGAGALVVALWVGRRGVIVALGALAPVAVCLAWLAFAGALPAAREIFTVVAPGYTALGWEGQALSSVVVATLWRWPSAMSGAIAGGLVCALVGWRFLRARRATAVVAGIGALQLAGVVAQAKLFAYHYAGLAPLAALLAALGWWWALRATGRARPLVPLACGALALVFTATPPDLPEGFWRRSGRRIVLAARPDDPAGHALASVSGVRAADNHRLAAALRELTPAGARVFIWGFEPAVYLLADRRPASAYLYDVPQRIPWFSPVARPRLIAELEATPPAAVVVEHGDVFPWVTGDHLDSAAALATFPALGALIAARCRLHDRIASFDIYLCTDAGVSPGVVPVSAPSR